MGKIKVWTRQDENILNQIENLGSYRVDKSYVVNRYEEHSSLYLEIYHWFSIEASKIVPRPEGVKYPIWLTVDPLVKVKPIKGQVLLELEIDLKDIIIMDAAKWDYILNYWYIPRDEEDNMNYLHELERQGIKNQTSVYMSNFYPALKRQVIESWKRLFDNSVKLSSLRQGAIWEIKKEWIVKVTRT